MLFVSFDLFVVLDVGGFTVVFEFVDFGEVSDFCFFLPLGCLLVLLMLCLYRLGRDEVCMLWWIATYMV